MRVSISVWCDTEEEAQAAIRRLYRKETTWVDVVEKETSTVAKPVMQPTVDDPLAQRRANVSPGEPTIGKIGTTTKDEILEKLKKGGYVPDKKWVEHMKLLWKRDEVRFDGTEYYLAGDE